jgi:hypothetical protein
MDMPAFAPLEAPEPIAKAPFSPFITPPDPKQIVDQLSLTNEPKLFIPEKYLNPDYEYRFCNGLPGRVAYWHSRGYRPVDRPELVRLYEDLHGGTTREGVTYRPVLLARPKVAGEVVREKHRARHVEQISALRPRANTIPNLPENTFVDPGQSTFAMTGDGAQSSLEIQERMRKQREQNEARARWLTENMGKNG